MRDAVLMGAIGGALVVWGLHFRARGDDEKAYFDQVRRLGLDPADMRAAYEAHRRTHRAQGALAVAAGIALVLIAWF